MTFISPATADDLGVRSDASAAEVRAQFMRRLQEEDFVPPEPWCRPLQLLRCPNQQHALTTIEEESQLHEEVEAFAVEFFELPVEVRRRHWLDLQNRCASCLSLTMRLAHLEEGMEVAPVQFDDRRMQVLWENVQELFVLKRAQQASLTRKLICKELKPEQRAWATAARRFRNQHPKLAGLNEFIDRFIRRARNQHHRRVANWLGVILVACAAVLVPVMIASLPTFPQSGTRSIGASVSPTTHDRKLQEFEAKYRLVVDPQRKRIIAVDRKTGKIIRKRAANPDDVEVLSVFPTEDSEGLEDNP